MISHYSWRNFIMPMFFAGGSLKLITPDKLVLLLQMKPFHFTTLNTFSGFHTGFFPRGWEGEYISMTLLRICYCNAGNYSINCITCIVFNVYMYKGNFLEAGISVEA